jgi:hypothetical protein
MNLAIATARPCGAVTYAATIPRAKSIQLSAAAPLRPRFLTQRYQFKGRAMTNKQPNKLEILGACALGAALGGGLIYVFILRTGWY